MLKLITLAGCVCLVLAALQDKMSEEAEINTLRVMRRLQGIQQRGLRHVANRQKKDGDPLMCNACSFSGNTTGCEFTVEDCATGQICCDIWRTAGNPRNYNGCINPELCKMISSDKDTTYVRVECCGEDFCNW